MHKRMRGLKGTCGGRRGVIMGNGPSLNEMDLEVFASEAVWGSNRAYLLYDRISWRHEFYVCVDTRVVPDIAEQLGKRIEQMQQTRFFFPYHFRQEGVLQPAENIYWYNQVPQNPTGRGFGMFTSNAAAYVVDVRTVTIAAMQLAVHLGFNPIYLIGCDNSYSVPATVRVEDAEGMDLTSTADDDPNHFDPTYFGKGRKWHDPRPDLMEEHYVRARQFCRDRGVEVYNATVGGKLEVFPRVDYRDVFGRSN